MVIFNLLKWLLRIIKPILLRDSGMHNQLNETFSKITLALHYAKLKPSVYRRDIYAFGSEVYDVHENLILYLQEYS